MISAATRGRRHIPQPHLVTLAAVAATGGVRPLSGSASPQFILPAVAATGARASFSIRVSKSVALTAVAGTGAVHALTPTANPSVNLVAVAATGAVVPLVAGGPQTVTLVKAAATGAAAAFSVTAGGSLTVEITFPGGVPTAATLVFDSALGTNMGDYVAPTAGFTQHCVRVRHASLSNFWVDFRPDASGTRTECVFWNGECDPVGLTVPSGYTRNLAGYTAVVKQGGSTLSTTVIPRHYWGQRWRWQSAARTVIRTSAQVFSGGFLPPMTSAAGRIAGYSGVIVPPVPAAQANYTPFMAPNIVHATTTAAATASLGATSLLLTNGASPFTDHGTVLVVTQSNGATLPVVVISGSGVNPVTLDRALEASVIAGATVYQSDYKLGCLLPIDAGGERPEIGLITEWQGDWLLRGTASSLTTLLNHAEMWSSDLNWFMMWDKQTGAALNFKSDNTRYLSHSYTTAVGTLYWVQRGLSNGFQWAQGEEHAYNMVYLPWVLTEDPYYIETQQAMCSWYMGWFIGGRDTGGALSVLPVGTRRVCSYIAETRTWGWGLRNLAMAWRMSPASPPSWLQPQSLFSALSDDYAYVADYYWRTPGHGAEANVHSIFRLVGNSNYYQAFEQAFALYGLSMAVFFGMPVVTAPSWNTLLNFFFGMFDGLLDGTSGWNQQLPQPHDLNFTTPGQSDYLNINSFSTWGTFYTAFAAIPGAKINSDPSPANQQGGTLTNANYMVAACAIAKSLGVPTALTAKTWLDTYIDYNWPLPAYQNSFAAKDGFSGT